MNATPMVLAHQLDSPYGFDNDTPDAANQVHMLAGIMDPDSVAALDPLGIRPGWRCLDVGPGAGSITHWLADQVGATGHVTALDIKPQHVPAGDNITIVTDDIRTADLEPDHYDLVHARLVLTHLPARQAVLGRLVAATKPGGWVVISEWDFTHPDDLTLHLPSPEATEAFIAYQRALTTLIANRGADAAWARRVPTAMRTAGLVDVQAVAAHRLWYGGEPGCLLHQSNSQQLEASLLDAGMDLNQLLAVREAMVNPETLTWQYPLITTLGRRPTR
ncbi:MAG: methyltransferase domain-containing protein [Micromonosporaceae bacterium]|nr:methyltransferase domain-containing protein [Micromonosporaceae bacterium]